jgi:hypothetical protein
MLRISLARPLPARPRRLGADELERVFGGCNQDGGSCSKDTDCCGSSQPNTTYGCGNGVCFSAPNPF